MKLIVLTLFIFIFFIALIFSVLNFHSVQINFGFTSFSLPLTLALTIQLFAGIVIGLLVSFFQILRMKSDYQKLNKKFEKINKLN